LFALLKRGRRIARNASRRRPIGTSGRPENEPRLFSRKDDPMKKPMEELPQRSAAKALSGGCEGLYATGQWLLSQQRIGHAVTVFRAMIALAPLDERGWLGLGACHEARGNDEGALQVYVAASAFARSTPRGALARARVCRKLGRDQAAREAVEEARRMAVESGDGETWLLREAELEEKERGGP
jgi:hypothetical protein